MRGLTAAELLVIEVLARSRTASVRQVERAQIIRRTTCGETPRAIAAALRINAETVRRRIRRFDIKGLASLEDHPRSGRPATYSAKTSRR
jgi:transposase